MVSFYGWNRIDRFMAAWKRAGFSVVGHLCSPKATHPNLRMSRTVTNAPISWQKAVRRCLRKPLPDVLAGNIRATAITRRKSLLPACNR